MAHETPAVRRWGLIRQWSAPNPGRPLAQQRGSGMWWWMAAWALLAVIGSMWLANRIGRQRDAGRPGCRPTGIPSEHDPHGENR